MKNNLRHLMTWLGCWALLGAFVLGLPASRVSSASSLEILKPVSQNIDDGFYGASGFYPDLVWNESGYPIQSYNAWYRFNGIYLPKGSTILEAHLEIMETRWTSGTKLRIYADDSAVPVAPGSTAIANAKVRTTAYVDWTSGYSDGLYHNSPDFAQVIQELVNVNDYSSGAIQILVDDNSSSPGTEMVVRTFEYGAPPRLFIKYQDSSSVPIITSISPPAGSAGTNFEVTIFGSNFGDVQGTSKVEFWRRTKEYASSVYVEASVVSWSDSQITCHVPSLAGGSRVFDGKIRGVQIITSSGISNNLPFKITFATSGDLKWGGPSPMGTRFFVNDTLANNSQALQAVLDAAQSWNNVSGANFYFEYGGRTSVTDGQNNGISEIIWKPIDSSTAFAFIQTEIPGYSSPIVEGDVYLNSNKPWVVDGSTPYDVQAIVTHELGHWFSLSDLYGDLNTDQVMYGSISGQRIPTPADVEGIRYLYPGIGTRGQYHVIITNNSGKPLSIYFKADSNADLSPVLEVPAGQTVTSWSRVVEAGNHSVILQWNDPDTGTANSITSSVMNVPIEGNTGYSFIVPDGTPSPVNHPPVLDPIGNKTVNTGQALTFTVSAADADKDPLTYSASSLPAGATFNTSTHVFSWTPATAGIYSGIVFSVTDGKSTPVTEAISITVSDGDTLAPTVTLSSTSTSPTKISPIPVTATFSEAVTGFATGDITVGNGTADGFVAVSDTIYTFNVTPTAQGAVTIDIAAGVAQDGAGNNNTASARLSITYDSIAPTVTLSSTSTSPTKTSPIPVTATFSEAVNGFEVGDIKVGNGTISNFAAVNASVYTFNVTPTANGTVTVDVAAGVAQDAVGNNNTAATQLSITYDTSVSDTTAPTISSVATSGITSTSATITWTTDELATSNLVYGLTTSYGSSSPSPAEITADKTSHSITISGLSSNTTYHYQVKSKDDSNNEAISTDKTFITSAGITDTTAPTITLSSTITSPTKTSPIPVTAIFSEPVTSFTVEDITVGNGTADSFVAVSTTVYTFSVTPTAQGAVTIDITDGVAQDAVGNNNTAAEQFSITYNSLVPDTTAPTVTLSSTITSPTKTSPIPVTATFSEPVIGFTVGDITIGNGTADSFVTVSTTVYTFNVTPAAQGAVTIDIAAGVAQDAAGNSNTAAAQFSEQYSEKKGEKGGCGRGSAKAATSSTGLAIGWISVGLFWGGGYYMARRKSKLRK